MIDIQKGRYWDKPWSLVSSCTRVSPGCENCWSLAMEKRFHKGEEGKIVVHYERLDVPLRRKKPTVFSVWNDLFHEAVTTAFLDEILEVMSACPQHTFLVLTKRPERMQAMIYDITEDHPIRCLGGGDYVPNLWLGVTAENQEQADNRIQVLTQIPAAKRFVSIEPMLSEIDLDEALFERVIRCGEPEWEPRVNGIHCVILGGESGPHARPMHPDWVRSVRDQCAAAGVPFFFKQWGEWLPHNQREAGQIKDSVRYGHNSWAWRVGSNVAGRLLDGRSHDDLPWVKA